jgi:hypothetical protein
VFLDGIIETGISTAPTGKATATYGYTLGGIDSSGNRYANTDRFTFSSQTNSLNTVSNLSVARRGIAPCSDKTTYGYAAGGETGSLNGTTTTDRTTFSSGTTAANTVSNMTFGSFLGGGLSDGGLVGYGYFMGGFTYGTIYNTTDRITFSSGTTALNTVSNLSVARNGDPGICDNVAYGYAGGGITSAGGTGATTTTDRVTFSSGTTAANTVSNLSLARGNTAALNDGSTYGYWCGGGTSTTDLSNSTTDRITYSSGTTASATVSNLLMPNLRCGGITDGGEFGYVCGGYTSSSSFSSWISRIAYSGGIGTFAFIAALLDVAVADKEGFSDHAV